MRSDIVERWLLWLGLVISTVLLIRFAIDFWIEMKWWSAMPFSLLVTSALWAGSINVLGSKTGEGDLTARPIARNLLIALVPLGFFASSLDCTGLSLHGCSPLCTFIKLVWIPLIGAACIVYSFTRKRGWQTVVVLMSYVTIVPHCVCSNVGNGWWINALGASPLCYGWGFCVSIIVLGALRRGTNYWPTLAVSSTILAGAMAFFVAHHYFRWPW